MSPVRCNVRNIFSPHFPFLHRPPIVSLTRRTISLNALDKKQIKPIGAVAERLAATNLWISRRGRKSDKDPKGDKTRVNVVGSKLCDDILSYIGPDLDRHKGCDLIDIYPGAGLWSRKLHDYLEPRSHILMEPDSQLYEPFLKPLLSRPNTTLIPKSGLVWRELTQILTPEHLPHQKVLASGQAARRNDELLVTANIAFHPKKRFQNFGSLVNLVLYQFIDAIRTRSLFQRYGLVRMLIWTRHDDKHGLIPKVLQRRKKLAVDSELSCEWVHEVCGPEDPDYVWYVRDDVINASSNVAAWRRMRDAKMKMPKERDSEALKEARKISQSGKIIKPGITMPSFKRSYQETLRELEEEWDNKSIAKGSDRYKRWKHYQWRHNWEEKKSKYILALIKDLDNITALRKSGEMSPEEIKELETEWEENVQAHSQGFVDEFIACKDNLHYYRQDPPLLHWDRRQYESMVVKPEEFYPNIPCTLIDIQPKPVHPLMHQTGPNSNRAGDCFDLILSSLMTQSTTPIKQALDSLMPGAADYIIPRWKSIRDVDHGGVLAQTRYTELTPRMLNARQWEELLELWMEWPFRPQFHDLVARTHDEMLDEDSILPGE
ncbi:S-adenosyl-L-methionine-dependent methyltransferase [Annulohypoxylon truncatum]|uniref:S-adenosyl-L-methionine-dependent methyltransferase n=1 Tax=Annulohypoxylon truncatum TaxID=327061 RepID=UPI00200754D9|nr:S-adenosyl-L-methionine-dependent methyltransferase [Annulohypoxylon truncatum]KAI1207581.1 S-adenosyl-L-methionine-dependent methyltransferase [Annulohypoxylon truncatum]